MIHVRRSADRGRADHGWLQSAHSFSFGEYFDPAHKGFGLLRVINEDWIAGGKGFAMHGHRDMEIISYIVSGALEHQDSMGHKAVIRPGEIQRMSAGTGVQHSEFNPHLDQKTHLLQIWILPDRAGHTPSYGQISFEEGMAGREFALLASPQGREGSMTLHQDVDIYLGRTKTSGNRVVHEVSSQRDFWIQVIAGQLSVMGEKLTAGDGAGIRNQPKVEILTEGGCEFLFFDMAVR